MSIGLVVIDLIVPRYILHSKNVHFLGKENKRADFPKILEKFTKIRDQAELNREREDCHNKILWVRHI